MTANIRPTERPLQRPHRATRASKIPLCLALAAIVSLTGASATADDTKPAKLELAPDRLARITEILRAVGWSRVPNADFYRANDDTSGDDAGLQIWTLSARGGDPRRLTDDSGYTWPVFGPDGKSVAALGHEGLVVIDTAKKRRIVWEPPADDPPKIVLAWTGVGISVVTLSGRVVLVKAESGDFSTVDRAPVGITLALVQATRSTGDGYVDTAVTAPNADDHGGRADVLLHTKSKSASRAGSEGPSLYTSRNLTRALKTVRHLEPALSPDGKRVVFVAGP